MMAITERIKLAKQQLKSGQLTKAEESSRRILQIDADQPDAYHILGIIHHHTGRSDIAADLVTKAIAINSHMPDYHYNLGIIYSAQGYTDEAIRSYQAAIDLKPDYAEALNNLGLILYDQDHIEESIILFQQAIRSKSDYTNAYYNLANAMQAQGDFQHAIENYGEVLKIVPGSAETRFNRSLLLLLTENFKEGWREYEWRFKNLKDQTKKLNQSGIHRWDGTPFIGKRLLVVDEQGIGDTLQFIRYLPMVKNLGGTVIFNTIQPLIGLLRNFDGIDLLLAQPTLPRSDLAFDLYIPLMSLPGIFHTTLETIPADIPYIFPSAEKVHSWRSRFKKDRFHVGIVWAGKPSEQYQCRQASGLVQVDLKWAGIPASKIAESRSDRLEYFEPLARIRGIRLYGLQKGESALQAKKLSPLIPLVNLGEKFTDFSDTAAAIEHLDLVISVDTSVAHLAGAMGKPVWVLIPFVPDWRWMLKRGDSPWYPTMRLFRQSKNCRWDEVFQRVATELHALVHQ